jgi:hypothetical protein
MLGRLAIGEFLMKPAKDRRLDLADLNLVTFAGALDRTIRRSSQQFPPRLQNDSLHHLHKPRQVSFAAAVNGGGDQSPTQRSSQKSGQSGASEKQGHQNNQPDEDADGECRT